MDLRLMVGKALYFVKKHAPEILIISGATGTVVATVFACKATVKAKQIVEEHTQDVEDINSVLEVKEDYTEEDAKNDIRVVRLHEIKELAKCYALPFGIEVLSVGCILAGAGILQKRFVGIASAYTALNAGFNNYRNRVKNKLGAEEENKLFLGIEEEEQVEKVTDENGKTHKVKTTVVKSINPIFKYSIIIDENHPMWNQDPEVVVFKLLQTQEYINDALISKRYITYDYVCEQLFDTNHVFEEGAILGWTDNPNLSVEDRKQQISFGLRDENDNFYPDVKAFMEGKASYVVLNFNFDGPVIDIAPRDE